MIRGGTAPAYREDLRSYDGPICPSISYGRCIEPALKDVDWPKPLGKIPRVVHTDVFDLVTFAIEFVIEFSKGYEVGMTNLYKSYFVIQVLLQTHNYICMSRLHLLRLFSFFSSFFERQCEK